MISKLKQHKFFVFYFLIICISCNENIDGIWELEQLKFVPQDLSIEKDLIIDQEYKSNCKVNHGYNLLRIQNNAGTINHKSHLNYQQLDSIKVESNKMIWFANMPCQLTYTFKQEENQIFIFDDVGETVFIGTKIAVEDVNKEREFFAKSMVEIKLPKNTEFNCNTLVEKQKDIFISIGKSKSKVPTDKGIRNWISFGDKVISEIDLREFQKDNSIKNRRLLVYADQSADLTWLTTMIFSKHAFLAFAEDQEDFQICWVSFSEFVGY